MVISLCIFVCLVIFNWMPDSVHFALLGAVYFVSLYVFLKFVLGYSYITWKVLSFGSCFKIGEAVPERHLL